VVLCRAQPKVFRTLYRLLANANGEGRSLKEDRDRTVLGKMTLRKNLEVIFFTTMKFLNCFRLPEA